MLTENALAIIVTIITVYRYLWKSLTDRAAHGHYEQLRDRLASVHYEQLRDCVVHGHSLWTAKGPSSQCTL